MDSISPPPRACWRKTWGLILVVGCLLGLYGFLALRASREKCTTYDEIAHLTSGYSYWLYHDYRLQPENGNWPQRWAALPLLVSQPHFPDQEGAAWQKSNVWKIGNQFFYKENNDADWLLLQGRAMICLLGVVLGLGVFCYGRSLFGWPAGLLSLMLFVFCPTMLAHGALITSDMAAALFFLGSLATTWWVMHELTPWSLLLSSLFLGGLFLAKFSAVIILPVLVILLGIRVADGRPLRVSFWRQETLTGRGQLLGALPGVVLVQAVVVWAMIWGSFGWRYSVFADNSEGELFPLGWDYILNPFGFPETMGNIVQWAKDQEFLPEGYIYGFAFTVRFSQRRWAFLNGEISTEGWPWFFPYAFLVKTPLAVFPILVLALLSWKILWGKLGWKAAWGRFYTTAPLWIFLAVFWAFAMHSHLNIGHRHILPTYPVMYILAGSAISWLGYVAERTPTKRWLNWLGKGLLLGSLGWLMVESLSTWPNYLAYFNQVVGGPRHGYKHLVDSSLDWGQDLPALKKWLEARGMTNERVLNLYLSYFGTGEPIYYGIDAVKLPVKYASLPREARPMYVPGTYCISATYLQGVYREYPEPWDERLEAKYRESLLFRGHYNRREEAASKEWLEKIGQDQWLTRLNQAHALTFARLCHYLRQRPPDDQVGYSILIFQLGEGELHKALD
jgi:hypothetical protein